MSVEPSPASTTSPPRLITPSAKARDSGTEDSRMSWAVTIAVAPLSPVTNSANAAPIARLTSSSHSSGTTPRTSYALMIDDRSGNAAHPRTRGITHPGWHPVCADPNGGAGEVLERPPFRGPRRACEAWGEGWSSSGQVGKDPEVTAAGAAAVVGRVARGLWPGRLAGSVGECGII